MTKFDVIVVGGGAAGLMAAGQSASLGARTLILEKMDQPGRKIFITGKFRCNITNTANISDFVSHFGRKGRFLRQAFHQFFSDDLMDFFQTHGVPTKIERGGRVFPKSDQSKDVVNALVNWCKNLDVQIETYSPVNRFIIESDHIKGVETEIKKYPCDSVILASGGASYPGTGSTGDGYELAKLVGHTIIPIRPALVPLTTFGNVAQNLQGLSLRNVGVSIVSDNKIISHAFGEMLFTHFGVSGPVILSLSKQVVDILNKDKEVEISIDLKPSLDYEQLNHRLLRDFDKNGKKQFRTYLPALVPKKLIPICINQTKIPENKTCNQITAAERKNLQNWLKDFRLRVEGHRGFRHAIVTAGGIDTREINPRTMESLIINGLFFAGEVIDLDADTGGYNLQAAFSTGWLAGRSAVQQRG